MFALQRGWPLFLVWDDGGIKAPYVPGSIRGRKVEKVTNTSAIQKTTPHTKDSQFRGLRSSSAQALTDIYQASDHQTAVRAPAILAKQIMSSPVLTLSPTAELSDAWEIIQRKRFRHIPVLSSQGHLVGILSDRDLFRATIEIVTSLEQLGANANQRPIQQIMVRNILSASPETEIRAIARILFEERIGAMPIVTEQGNLVGILTRSDILRTVVNEAPFELWI